MQLSIETNFPDVVRQYNALQANLRNVATASAINKTLDQAKTQMIREITANFNVKAGYVRDRLSVRRASARGFVIEGSLQGGGNKGRSANIIAFVERKVSLATLRRRTKAGTRTQLFVQVLKGGSPKPLAGAFIGNKGRTVFERVGKSRLPIKPVQVIDVAQMFNTKRINSKVVQALKDKFPAIFAREAKFFTDRFNGPIGSSFNTSSGKVTTR